MVTSVYEVLVSCTQIIRINVMVKLTYLQWSRKDLMD